jgi:predicted O-linked N-acetylglucosamine transferase (SPINDLY family)
MLHNRSDGLRDQAYHLYQAGDRAVAERLCRQLLDEFPNHAEAVYLLGVIAHDKSDKDQACKLFGQAAALAPANAVYRSALGEAQLALGRTSDATSSFRQAIALRPDYERAYNNLGLYLHGQADFVAAAASFKAAVRINPKYAIAHTNLGAVVQALGRHADAVTHFRESSCKIEPGTFDLWMRILSRVPGSVLGFWSPGRVVENNLRREARARGVDPDRLVFAPFVARPKHMRRHQAADLPGHAGYNAAATASLALQLGLPVLTYLGGTFASRVCASLLTTVGLPELIAAEVASYERIAIELAQQPQDIRRLRSWLAATKSMSPMFDTPRFVRNLEFAYSEMPKIHAAGSSPRPIRVIDDFDQ